MIWQAQEGEAIQVSGGGSLVGPGVEPVVRGSWDEVPEAERFLDFG